MKTKAQKLLERMHRLQADIYDLSSIMEERNRTKEGELMSSAGFELDHAMALLKIAIEEI